MTTADHERSQHRLSRRAPRTPRISSTSPATSPKPSVHTPRTGSRRTPAVPARRCFVRPGTSPQRPPRQVDPDVDGDGHPRVDVEPLGCLRVRPPPRVVRDRAPDRQHHRPHPRDHQQPPHDQNADPIGYPVAGVVAKARIHLATRPARIQDVNKMTIAARHPSRHCRGRLRPTGPRRTHLMALTAATTARG
jgi:hypothetical protein